MGIFDWFIRIFGDSIDKSGDVLAANREKVRFAEAKVCEEGQIETLDVKTDSGQPLPPHGVLKAMGYHVGKSGLNPKERREILWRTFRVQLVCGSDSADDYIREWGNRCSRLRLAKLDRTLGGLAANAERKTKTDMSEAIRDWREDQAWLRTKHDDWLTHDH